MTGETSATSSQQAGLPWLEISGSDSSHVVRPPQSLRLQKLSHVLTRLMFSKSLERCGDHRDTSYENDDSFGAHVYRQSQCATSSTPPLAGLICSCMTMMTTFEFRASMLCSIHALLGRLSF